MTKVRDSEIQKFLEGDDSVFPQIFSAYRNRIYYIAIDILHNQADCEDVVQNTFIKIIAHRNDVKEAKAFNSWVYRIAYNNCLDLYRGNKRRKIVGEDMVNEFSDKNGDANDMVSRNEIFNAIQDSIDTLPTDVKHLCLLRFIGECSIEEISEMMGLPVGTVKSRLHRAKKSLKLELQSRDVTPAVYLSFSFLPFTYKYYTALVNTYATMSPSMTASVSNSIEQVTGVATGGLLVGGTGMLLSGKVALAIVAVTAGSFGTYTYLQTPEAGEARVANLYEIDYLDEMTNENLQIVLLFDGKPNEEDIKVFDTDTKEALAISNVKDNIYAFIVNKNGVYEVNYGDYQKRIEINNIDKESPVLSQIEKEEDLIKIVAKDNLSGIDFEKSHVKEAGNNISLAAKSETEAYLVGVVSKKGELHLYDKSGNYQVYEINAILNN